MPAPRKLTDQQVSAIRAAWCGWNAAELAREFGVSKQWIFRIVTGHVRRT